MRKRIKARIEKAKIQSEFNVDLIPRRAAVKHPRDFIKRALRDDDGNHINKDGEIVLTHIHADMGKTLTPSEQYRKSHLRKVVHGIVNLMKDN